jgi:hypothetical protein
MRLIFLVSSILLEEVEELELLELEEELLLEELLSLELELDELDED